MRKRLILGISLALAAAFAFFATQLERSAPVLTIIKTSLPSCETRTYTISPKSLRVKGKDQALAQAMTSPALLHAATDPVLRLLEPLYEDPNVMDGFELTFQFKLPGEAKTVTVRNRYVPALYRILEECNKLLAADTRFTEKEHFVLRNIQLQESIAKYRAEPVLPEELQAKIIAELERQKVKIEE